MWLELQLDFLTCLINLGNLCLALLYQFTEFNYNVRIGYCNKKYNSLYYTKQNPVLDFSFQLHTDFTDLLERHE